MKHSRPRVAISLLAAGAMALSACNKDHATLSYTSGVKVDCGGKQTLAASGSTAQANAMTRFIDAYNKVCPGQSLNYTANGSGNGISEFLAGKTDFGGSDTPLSGDQYAAAKQRCGGADAWNLPVVFGPMAITYNLSAVDSLVLDAPTLAKIFNGTITRWDDPALTALNASMPAEDIRVIYRSDASGTTYNFQSYLQAASGGAWTKGASKMFNGGVGTGAAGNKGTSALVKTTEGAISYNELSYALSKGFTPPRSRPRQAAGRYARCGSAPTRSARPSRAPKSSAKATTSCSTFRRSTTPPNPMSTRSSWPPTRSSAPNTPTPRSPGDQVVPADGDRSRPDRPQQDRLHPAVARLPSTSLERRRRHQLSRSSGDIQVFFGCFRSRCRTQATMNRAIATTSAINTHSTTAWSIHEPGGG